MNKKDKLNIKYLRRSPYLDNPIKKNTFLRDANVTFKRPGIGLSPSEYAKIKNYKFKLNLPKSSLLKKKYLKKVWLKKKIFFVLYLQEKDPKD